MASVRCGESLQLLRALQRVGDGHGGVVELHGDPGSGKTRLLAQLMAAARDQGVRVLDGRCYPAERDAFCVFTRALGDLVTPQGLARLSPAHAELVRAGLCARRSRTDPPPQPLPLSQAVHALLADAADGGLLLVLDDFHWADPKSLELADHLVRWSLRAPLLIVIAHRPRQADPLLLSTLAYGAEQGRVTRVGLGPINPEQAARLLNVRPDTGWLRSAYLESQGNILNLLVLGESAPLRPSLTADLVTGRLAPLTAELELLNPVERLVAESGAVLGDRFTREEVADVCELPFDEVCMAVTGLIRLDILRPLPHSATRFVFRHPVLRELVHERADHRRRRQAHRRALTVLNQRAAPAAERAVHIELSTSTFTPEDLETLARAGKEAALSAPEDALRWLLLALRGLASDDRSPGRLLGLVPPLARALQATDYLNDNEALRHLLTQDAGIRPDEAHHAAIRVCVLVECLHGRFAEADALLRTELARAGSTADTDLLARLTIFRGIVSSLCDNGELAVLASTALQLARSGGRATTLAGALSLHALAELTAGRTARSLAAYDAAVRQMDELPNSEIRLHTEYFALLGRCALLLGRPQEAESRYTRGIAVSAGRSPDTMLPTLLSGLAEAQLRQGRLNSARRSAADAADLAGRLGADRLRAYAMAQEALCITYAEPPGSSRASAYTEEALRALHHWSDTWHSLAVLTVAESLLLQGSQQRCLDLLLDLGAPDLGALSPPLRTRAYELLALASVSSGIRAALWAERAFRAMKVCPLPHTRAYALLARGHVLTQQNEPAAAITAYRKAERLFDGAQLRLQSLSAAVRTAGAASARGRPEEAEGLWTAARELADHWQVPLFAQLPSGSPQEGPHERGRPSAAPSPVPLAPDLAPLTRRELEVARLVGTGRRTREVAETLRVSPRTIEVHLSRIYRKLEIGSRAELARLMAVRVSTDARTQTP
ncbi:helix-turn-helix transcriptional regulator [Streptomyces sp. Ag109_G2-15]|uniref:helix-turn-helix transcriptional regulator n=1 Tax=Streptomyces sp. Ag109_G2-15 TaxID=1938850 RepID=UPI000BCD03AC|nr:helix-turn-helix transcriptional regulator [Streptomyces sp. Ag109_G2-15]SOD87000.1 regulatory protein, luxR family [Streptomyces sp. Ag109_G2-15]